MASGDVAADDYASAWLLWWTGDAMGDLIVAPLILVLATTPLRELRRPHWQLEAGSLLALLVAVAALVSLGGYWRDPHVIFPLLVWATLRFRQPGAVVGCFVVAAIAVAGGVAGTSPIAEASTTEIVQILEGLLAAVTISMLILGAVLTERASVEKRLERARARLAEAQEVARIGSWEWRRRSRSRHLVGRALPALRDRAAVGRPHVRELPRPACTQTTASGLARP